MPMPGRPEGESETSLWLSLQSERMGPARFTWWEIGTEVEVVEHAASVEGKETRRLVPGRVKRPAVTLQRPFTGDDQLWDWLQAVRDGKLESARLDCSLHLYDPAGHSVFEYRLFQAWPFKLEVSVLKGSERPLETLTLAAEDIRSARP